MPRAKTPQSDVPAPGLPQNGEPVAQESSAEELLAEREKALVEREAALAQAEEELKLSQDAAMAEALKPNAAPEWDGEPRLSRDQMAMEREIHPEDEFAGMFDGPMSVFPDIPAREGMAQRWVRVQLGLQGHPDVQNLQRQTNFGWVARDPATVPKNIRTETMALPGDQNAIFCRGLVLMERPQAMHDAHRKHLQKLAGDQLRAADEDVFRDLSQTGFRPGRPERTTTMRRGRPMVADD